MDILDTESASNLEQLPMEQEVEKKEVNNGLYSTSGKFCDKTFIHFNDNETLTKFIEWYKGDIGHICCGGKGCHLKDVKNWIEIKQDFRSHQYDYSPPI